MKLRFSVATTRPTRTPVVIKFCIRVFVWCSLCGRPLKGVHASSRSAAAAAAAAAAAVYVTWLLRFELLM